MVQQLRIHLSMWGTRVEPPGLGRTYYATEQLSLRTTTTGVLRLLQPGATQGLELTAMTTAGHPRAHELQLEKLSQWEALAPQGRVAPEYHN